MLVDISEIDLGTTLLGMPLKLPIGIAPSAMHGLAHPDAECATARAAALMGGLMTLSTLSNSTIEEVAGAAPGRWWFQLYLYRDREVSRALVQRAEAAGARSARSDGGRRLPGPPRAPQAPADGRAGQAGVAQHRRRSRARPAGVLPFPARHHPELDQIWPGCAV